MYASSIRMSCSAIGRRWAQAGEKLGVTDPPETIAAEGTVKCAPRRPRGMHGSGVPLITPFDDDGSIDEPALRETAAWVVDQGLDFVVPCGSNGESELLTVDERARVTEIVVDEVSVPVMAGTGHPGFEETMAQTERAAEAGAEAALVVTPFYFGHDQDALEAYFRRVATESPLPIYLYSVPKMTNVALEPETVGRLADHDNVAGMKDSTGDLAAFQRINGRTGDDFDLMTGSGSLLGPALAAGGVGGINALANVVPDLTAEIYRLHDAGNTAGARSLTADLVELNTALTATYGIPAVKAAMRYRGVPAGHVRFPHQSADEAVVSTVQDLVDDALDR
jgi:4-hydroxy-tetrahydrodipicolinate synthase